MAVTNGAPLNMQAISIQACSTNAFTIITQTFSLFPRTLIRLGHGAQMLAFLQPFILLFPFIFPREAIFK